MDVQILVAVIAVIGSLATPFVLRLDRRSRMTDLQGYLDATDALAKREMSEAEKLRLEEARTALIGQSIQVLRGATHLRQVDEVLAFRRRGWVYRLVRVPNPTLGPAVGYAMVFMHYFAFLMLLLAAYQFATDTTQWTTYTSLVLYPFFAFATRSAYWDALGERFPALAPPKEQRKIDATPRKQ